MIRTVLVLSLGFSLFGAGVSGVVLAAAYPDKPLEILVGYPAGSSPDVIVRIIGDVATRFAGQPVIIENKLGASGSVAAAEVIKSKAEGYKLTAQTNIFFASTMKIQKVPFDPNDLAPLANFAEFRQELMVRADSPFKSLNDLLDHARKNPGQLKWAHAGRGTSLHLTGLYVFKKAGVETIDVPYRGGPEMVAAALGGHVDAYVGLYGSSKDQVLAGKIRVLAVGAEKRYPDQPSIPTVVELGFPDAAKLGTYLGLYVHRNTPEPIRAHLTELLKKVYEDPRVKRAIEDMGEVPRFGGPEFMKESVRKAEEVTVPMLKELGLYVGR